MLTLPTNPLTAKNLSRWRSSSLLLALLLFLLPLGGVGCGQGGLFGPRVEVAANADTAIADGKKKEQEAREAIAAGKPGDATKLWTEAANYYGAVASKFAGTETGLQAVLAQGSVNENGLKDENSLNAAHLLYRSALTQYPKGGINEALREQLFQAEERVLIRLDEINKQKFAYKVMDVLVRVFGNDPKTSPIFAVLFIALFITVILWPLRRAQYKNFKEMQRFQPEMKKLQEKYKEDPLLLQEKMREFQKEHGFNPFAGCLPALVQLPVTLGMYQVILAYQYNFRVCNFLWINPANGDAASRFPAPLSGFIGHNLSELDMILLIVYGISMFLQMKITPATDPSQADQQKMMAITMPVMFFIMMLQWKPASAFVLYWFVSNLLSMAQQWYIYRTLPTLPPLVIAGSDSAAKNGASDSGAKQPLTANPKLVSPKNRRKK
ncbi:MAG: membrane protein insertase YidC [Cytophagales bacterium]|nr:membrane protein insertase YidC [Armatimonadota bacterium]